MGYIADVTGVSVNVLADKEMLALMRLYLGNDYMNTVYMVSVSTLKSVEGDDELKKVISEADLVIPAEKIILGRKHRHMARGVVKSYMCILYMLRYKGFINSIYVIGENEKQTEKLVDVFASQKKELVISGSYSVTDDMKTDEDVLNDINSKAPDVVILALKSPDIERWVEEHKQKINTKLCVCMCDIAEKVIKENLNPPKWVTTLKLGGVYSAIIRRKYTDNKKTERIFNNLLADYNSKSQT